MKTQVIISLVSLSIQLVSFAVAQPVWHKQQDLVLDVGSPGTWDDARVGPDQILFENGVYRLWYTGWDGTTNLNFQIGLASSTDGINWMRDSLDPVVPKGGTGDWDSAGTSQPSVIKEGDFYKMWYSGGNSSLRGIGYAESPDGVHWTKHPGNPVLWQGSPGSWDSWSSHWCSVIKDGAQYRMWYSGGASFTTHRIGYATSPDGINWTKYVGNPVLAPDHCGSWDDVQVWFPEVVKEGSTFHMWYAGYDTNAVCRIGYAISEDGITWEVQECNPVLTVGGAGTWDDHGVLCATILPTKPWRMWYQGFDAGDIGRIGYATTASCGADLDLDGDVDMDDFASFQQQFTGPQ